MSTPTAELEPVPVPEDAPTHRVAPVEWVRENLFYSARGSVMTLTFGAFAVWAAFKVVRFVFVSAEWDIIRANLTLFMLGRYPRDEVSRLWIAMSAIALLAGVIAGIRASRLEVRDEDGDPRRPPGVRAWTERWWPIMLFVVAIAALVRTVLPLLGIAGLALAALGGREIGRRVVPARVRSWVTIACVLGMAFAFTFATGASEGVARWGGLLLTITLAVGGIAISFPLGILLALGRWSSLPAVRAVCVGYIELFRGVPLVAVLFVGDFALGFFLPPGSDRPAPVTRALVGFVLFTAAYIAEIVRGGLQSVPRGQVEAAQALGLSAYRITRRIVLPQALRAVIPALVGQFISLFKDTSLVTTIGLLELLGVAQAVTNQPRFLGQSLQAETLTFISMIYWAGAYWMSRASQRLELRLGVGER